MAIMKKIFLLIVALVACVGIYAQSVDEVTLVVNGSGATKEDAVHTALRGAIEQAFGVFVSANTSIVNDELVKDEIATVTSGNVKSFTELESVTLPNGNFAVTLQAVVSTQKLAAYAKSKGSSCEFAGSTFGANLKLLKLNQINTEKAFDNLMFQLETLAPYIFNYNLELGQPTQDYVYFDEEGEPIWNQNQIDRGNYKSCKKMGLLPVTLKITSNENTIAFTKLLKQTILALALNKQQVAEVNALGEKTYSLHAWEMSDSDLKIVYTGRPHVWGNKVVLRHPDGYSSLFSEFKFYSPFPTEQLNQLIENARNAYIIESNTGDMFLLKEEKKLCNKVLISGNNCHVESYYGTRLYAGYSYLILPEWPKSKKKNSTAPSIVLNTIDTKLSISVDKLMQISNFEIVKK